MTLRFLLDEDLSQQVAEGVRRLGIDAVSVHELRRNGLSDEEQLEFATAEERVLVSYNRADYQALDAQWRLEGRRHAGILWGTERSLPRRSMGDLVRAIAAASARYESLANLCLPLVRAL